jgi:hypothetical protein
MPAIPEAQLHMAGAAAVIVIAVYLVLEWVV